MKKQHYSKKREAILETISNTKSHPTAEWVYLKLKPLYPDLSLATVYRNIVYFKKNGNIITVANVNGQDRYDSNTSEHCHFICSECFSVIDIDIDLNNADIYEKIKRKYHFQPHYQNTIFYGKCEKCLNEL